MAATSTSLSVIPEPSVDDLFKKLYPQLPLPGISLKSKLGDLIQNVHKNHERLEGMGYIIDRIICKGAIERLSDCFYGANFKYPQKQRGKSASSRKWGIKFHRQIFHRYKCLTNQGRSCLCEKKFGVNTRIPKPKTVMHSQLKSFENFLTEKGWSVFDCELVVGWKGIRCATALDVVCVDDIFNPTQFYIIELKTGYSQRYQPRTIDDSGKMKGMCGKNIKNSYANHHQLQLWFGMEALRKTYHIDASNGVILYIKDDGKYKADYAASWWFHDLKTRKKLRAQLTGKISTFK